MPEPGSDSSQVGGYRVWQIPASSPGPRSISSYPLYPWLVTLRVPELHRSLQGGVEEESTDSLPSPQGGSGAVGRSRHQNAKSLRLQSRGRVSQPQPSPSPAPGFLPSSPAFPSFGCSKQSPLKQGGHAVSATQVGGQGTGRNTEGCWEGQGACLLFDWVGVVPGRVPCAGSLEGRPGWEWGSVIVGWHRFGQTQVKG